MNDQVVTILLGCANAIGLWVVHSVHKMRGDVKVLFERLSNISARAERVDSDIDILSGKVNRLETRGGKLAMRVRAMEQKRGNVDGND